MTEPLRPGATTGAALLGGALVILAAAPLGAQGPCTPERSAALLQAIRSAADQPEDAENLSPGVAPEGLPVGYPRHAVRQGPLLRVTQGALTLHGTPLPPLGEGGGESIKASLVHLREHWADIGSGPRPTFVLLLAPAELAAAEVLAPLRFAREGGFPDADLVVTDADEAHDPKVSPDIRRRIAAGPPDRRRADGPARQAWAAKLLSELAVRCAFAENDARELVRAVFGIRRQGTVRLRIEGDTAPIMARAPEIDVRRTGFDVRAGAAPRHFPTAAFRAAAGAVGGAVARLRVGADARYGDLVKLLLALDEGRRSEEPLRLLLE